MCKRANRPYAGGRGGDWLKVKCKQGQEVVVVGFTDPEGSREGLGALLVGVHDDGRLRFAGKVGTGYTNETLQDLRGRLDALETSKSPVADPPRGPRSARAFAPGHSPAGSSAARSWSRVLGAAPKGTMSNNHEPHATTHRSRLARGDLLSTFVMISQNRADAGAR